MFAHKSFWIWATGNVTGSVTVPLDRSHRYLVTGGLVGTEGGGSGQVYISSVCTLTRDAKVLCGVRDKLSDPSASYIRPLGLVEFLPANATYVTIKLRSAGGLHRAEGVIYDLS